MYLFPINSNDGSVDVDAHFVNACLKKIVGKQLKYAALGYNADQDAMCTLYKAEAYIVDLGADSSYEKVYSPQQKEAPNIDWSHYSEMLSMQEDINSLRRSYREKDRVHDKEQQTQFDIELQRLTMALDQKRSSVLQSTQQQPSTEALCIELVGDRFLRRMVRIMAATVLRESVLENRNDDVLVDICNGDARRTPSVAIMGDGLCFCGVGYDLKDLALYKMIPKKERELVMAMTYDDHRLL